MFKKNTVPKVMPNLIENEIINFKNTRKIIKEQMFVKEVKKVKKVKKSKY